MRAVIDEDLHRSISKVLNELKFKVYDIRDHGLRGKPDREIFKFAQKKKAVLFSGDLGFANTLTFPLGKHFGVCVLRFPNEMTTKTINEILKRLLINLDRNNYKGNLIIVSPSKVRIRKHKN